VLDFLELRRSCLISKPPVPSNMQGDFATFGGSTLVDTFTFEQHVLYTFKDTQRNFRQSWFGLELAGLTRVAQIMA